MTDTTSAPSTSAPSTSAPSTSAPSTSAPSTGSDLEPMFTTGSQAALTPNNTEPHPAPIFDTGPHPNPLRAFEAEPVVTESVVEPVVYESVVYEPAVAEPVVYESVAEPVVYESVAESVVYEPVVYEPVVAEPVVAEPVVAEPVVYGPVVYGPVVAEPVVAEPVVAEPAVCESDHADENAVEDAPEPSVPQAFSEMEREDTDAFLRSVNPDPVPVLADWPSAHPVPVLAQRPSAQTASVPAQPVVVPGTFEFVKRWRFALILVGVWAVSAVAGLGFYYWWYSALEKTVPVLGILGYLVICMVASLLVSLVPHRPQVTALAIALMAAPLASTAAAAVLHGAYYFEWIARPVIGPVIG